jgi:uncharacterized delta-60 repeat protein
MINIRNLAFVALAPGMLLANDGELDTTYGSQGRNATGYLETTTLVLRDIARSPSGGNVWKFSDDREDPLALYLARALPNGQPDATFGTNADGRRRTLLPAGLIAQAYGLDLVGATVQADGKPIVYGGLRPRNGSGGPFPAVVCRLAFAGNFEGSYGTSGCRTLRSFLSTTETCRVSDVAVEPDGMLVAVGNCAAPDLIERPFVARLTTAGTLDPEFGAGVGLITPLLPVVQARHRFEAVAVRPDSRVVVLGEVDRDVNAGLQRELGVWQFGSGGSPDVDFNTNGLRTIDFVAEGLPIVTARDLALRPDGRLVALGEALRTPDDARLSLLVSLDAAGAPVPGFGSGGKRVDTLMGSAGPASSLQRLTLDPQGRAIVAGALVEGLPDARPHAGTEFWFQFPASVPPSADVKLRISGDVATSGVVFSAFQNTSVPFQVQPGLITEVSISALFNLVNVSESLGAVAVQVSANAPVVVVPFAGRFLSTSSNALLPISELGREYRVQTWPTGLGSGSHIVVVAALPGSTAVTVRNSVAAGGKPAGTPIQVTLQQGDAYHLVADDAEGDMSGTLVSANRPVAVFGGHSCANIPNIEVEFCDQTFEQMEPLDRWGTDFIAVPFATRSSDVLRVLAHESGTDVEIDGDIVTTLAAGQTYSFSRSNPVRIRTSRPAVVAQFAKGCKVDQIGQLCPGDPAMLVVPPRSAWSTRQIAIVPEFSVDDVTVPTSRRFIGIVVPLEAVGSVTIDGVPIPAQSFAPVGDGRHAHAQLERPFGVDVVAAPVPISTWVYGFADSEGYAHQAATAPLSGDRAQSDDLILRYLRNGTPDARFGLDGLMLFDHAAAFETSVPSFDAAVRALPDGTGLLVGSATINRLSDQAFALDYRLVATDLFRDGFESD